MQTTWQLVLTQQRNYSDQQLPLGLHVMDGQLQRALSETQRLILKILSPQQLVMSQLLQQTVYLKLAGRIYFYGYITHIAHLNQQASASGQRYRITLHDALHYLQLRRTSQVFRMQASTQIIQRLSLFSHSSPAHITWKLPANRKPGIRPWVWQWRESNLSLCQRLWAAENWYALQILPATPTTEMGTNNPNYQLIDYSQWLQCSQQAAKVSMLNSTRLNNPQHKARYFSHIRPQYSYDGSCSQPQVSILARSPQLDWQLGECLRLDLQSLQPTTRKIIPMQSQNLWIISKIHYPCLHPKINYRSSHCQLRLRPLSELQTPQSVSWPRMHSVLPATVISATTSSSRAHPSNPQTNLVAVNGGYYAIQYDIEAENNTIQQQTSAATIATTTTNSLPLLPLLLESHTPVSDTPNKQSIPNYCVASQQPQLNLGSRVLVKMIDGDMTQPLIIGCRSSKQQPSVSNHSNAQQSILRTTQSESLLVDNQPASASVELNNAELQKIWLNAHYQATTKPTLNSSNPNPLADHTAQMGIAIHNNQGNIIHHSQTYSSSSNHLDIHAKDINYHAQSDIHLQSIQADIRLDANHIKQHATRHLQLHSQKNIHIQAHNINLQTKQAMHIISQTGDIYFSAKNELNIRQQKNGWYSAQRTLNICSYHCKLQMHPQHIALTANNITVQAGVLQVSGA